MKQTITHAELLAGYKYVPESGIFLNLKTGRRIGFYDKSCNKRKININDRNYAETRLAVFYVTGKWPIGFVKSTSKRKAYNTKLRDLNYSITILEGSLKHAKQETKKSTYFQRFLSMFVRL